MNIRKNIDYSEMYLELDNAMAVDMSQMELYCEIGKIVSRRREKGAAVAAAAYLSKQYPDAQGFSPRNLRRMRDFYRAYGELAALLSLALQLGWTQNVVILEADLSMEQREWYLKAASQFGWSKAELIEKIASIAHEMIVLAVDEEACCAGEQEDSADQKKTDGILHKANKIQNHVQTPRYRTKLKNRDRRRWPIIMCSMLPKKRIALSARRVPHLLLFGELFHGDAGAGHIWRRASVFDYRC